MPDKSEYTPIPTGKSDKSVYTTLRDVYKKARKAIFESDAPREFSVFDVTERLDERQKKIKRQVD
jgi:hypothetical protein